ncbi:hypothetical protein FKR81_37665 [Lentzea tibetensis]|uniref:Uncharacterized protein n=1 Tax=Lentzea tibetensis TaxID=2591470 RepID=A0A563EH84_9PSEU|nr:hypothetical protein [Lentzea tibetensis]TWP45952.1 hypothetical protein FKR81_37665 [Lentzea tibetensis]
MRDIRTVMGEERRDDRQPHERLKECGDLYATVAAWLELPELDEPQRPKVLDYVLLQAIKHEARAKRDVRSAGELLGFTQYSEDDIDKILAREPATEDFPLKNRERRTAWKPVRLLLAGTHQDPPIKIRQARDKQDHWTEAAAEALYHYLQYVRATPAAAKKLYSELGLVLPTAKWRRLTIRVAKSVAAAAIAIGFIIVLLDWAGMVRIGSPSSSKGPETKAEDIRALEQRYDGKDPRGYGKYPRSKEVERDSVCADKARPSEDLKENKPPVMGPDGKDVAVIELRRSTVPECETIIWARVLWNERNETATYKIPDGWTLHVIAHRPSTKTSFDFPEPEDGPNGRHDSPILYALSPMMTTASGCAYVEVYFTNSDRRTVSASTSCVKI